MASHNIAVVDYGVGNLFSVAQALKRFDLDVSITSDWREVEAADAVVLPGVGAFGPAIKKLDELELSPVIKATADSGKPLMGICLGLQLMGDVSTEFGEHIGLGIIPGEVARLPEMKEDGRVLKVPNIGWHPICPPTGAEELWRTSLLGDVPVGTTMYFVHTFHLKISEPDLCVAVSHYGDYEFCAAVVKDNIFACQFHPERSGEIGLRMYQKFAQKISESNK